MANKVYKVHMLDCGNFLLESRAAQKSGTGLININVADFWATTQTNRAGCTVQ